MSGARHIRPAAIAALLGLLSVQPVGAEPARSQAEVNAALRAVPQITGPLMAAGIAAGIAEYCPTISAREMRARTDALGLYNHARSLGYSSAEIRAFVRDRGERDWLEGQVRAWFAARGLRPNSPADGFCALGHAQIAENAPSARYLRAR